MDGSLLLLHAFPVDSRMWGPQAGEPGVIAPDLPGFGREPGRTAPPADGVLTMAAAAAAAIESLDRAGAERAMVCGLSLGGYVAFELWRRAPERIAALVLANTRAAPDTPEAHEGRLRLAARLRAEGNVLADDPPPLLSDEVSPALAERVRGWVADQSPETIAAAAVGIAQRPDSTPDLASIDVPTLVITSDRDRLIPPELSTPLADAIPGAELAVIEGAGHLSNVERPEAFTSLLRSFRERHASDAS